MICRAKEEELTKKHKKQRSLAQKKSIHQISTRFIKELKAEHKFYLAGEIVIDLDIFQSDYVEGDSFLPNPTNALKNLIKITLCSTYIEYETASIAAPLTQFSTVISTLRTIEHPRAIELALLLEDYQLKVQQREQFGKKIAQQLQQEGKTIDLEARKQESFNRATKIVSEFARNNPEVIFFFVIRRKGFESIEVLKSGYSMQAIKLSGYSIQEFEQHILREAGVPIRHQNSGWDYVKEKMYSNFHNKNYSGVRRKVSVKDGVVYDVIVSVNTIPLNTNLSSNPILIDVNDYLEIISVIPNGSSLNSQANGLKSNNLSLKDSNDNVSYKNEEYIESTKKFIQKFYSETCSSQPILKRKSRKLIKNEIVSSISCNSHHEQVSQHGLFSISENDRISSDIERYQVASKCSEYARTNDSEDGKQHHQMDEEEEDEIHEVNQNSMDEEDKDESITNYFDENSCIFNILE